MAGIKIQGGDIVPESLEAYGKEIRKVLVTAADVRADREVTLKALSLLENVCGVQGVNISGSSFQGCGR